MELVFSLMLLMNSFPSVGQEIALQCDPLSCVWRYCQADKNQEAVATDQDGDWACGLPEQLQASGPGQSWSWDGKGRRGWAECGAAWSSAETWPPVPPTFVGGARATQPPVYLWLFVLNIHEFWLTIYSINYYFVTFDSYQNVEQKNVEWNLNWVSLSWLICMK